MSSGQSGQIDEEFLVDERAHLISSDHDDDATGTYSHSPPPADGRVPPHITHRVLISHFLSTWNSRVFEFGAVLYLASICPNSLLPLSVYALARGLSAIFLAPAIGQYIDVGQRLQVVRVSIVFQRLAVAASCVIFYLAAIQPFLGEGQRIGMMVVVSLLACVEKLCSIMNMVSVERDWVVVVAENDEAALRILNAQMRRIDLLCKLFGPLFIALLDGWSTKLAIIVNFAMNFASVVVEYYAIAQVYCEVPALQQPKTRLPEEIEETHQPQSVINWACNRAKSVFLKSMANFNLYFKHRLFIPSIAGAMLYLTVLSFGAQMVTFLLAAGYSSTQIGLARTAAVVFEVIATFVAPWLMGKIGPVRAGLWLSTWQVATLVVGTAAFFSAADDNPLIAASGLIAGVILSRLGLRGFDLCTQLIVQEDVEAENRGAFSSVEAVWQNVFELLSYCSTIVFFKPEQFKWPSMISVTAISCASLCYTIFVYRKRGHLLHMDKIAAVMCTSWAQERAMYRGIERVTSNDSF